MTRHTEIIGATSFGVDVDGARSTAEKALSRSGSRLMRLWRIVGTWSAHIRWGCCQNQALFAY